ncbi:MAG: glycerophosphodiester phosphodiesterase family protein [Bacillota bacterium]
MRNRLHTFITLLKTNYKTLLLFEGFYRIFGIVAIFPLVQTLMSWSVSLSGYGYITNALILDYLRTPSTVLILILIGFILGLYIAFELITLSIIYRFSHHGLKLGLRPLIRLALERIRTIFLSRKVLIIFPAGLFFLFIELAQVAGVIATISIPDYLLDEIHQVRNWWLTFYGLGLILFILFFETVVLNSVFAIRNTSLKDSWRERSIAMKGKRIRMLLEFFSLNAILNGLLYLFYFLLVLLIAGIVTLIRGQDLALGLTLTVVYAIYTVVVTFASMILVPLNFALVTTWHQLGKPKEPMAEQLKSAASRPRIPLTRTRMRRLTIIIIMGLIAINITNVFTVLTRSKNRAEFFNQPEIVAHRGASWDAPENTLAAVDIALDQESDGIEIDVRMTKDEHVVLMHDSTLERTTNGNSSGSVENMTLEELRELDAGSWYGNDFTGEKIPTLEEVFELTGRKATLFIEMKDNNETINRKVVELIEENDMENHVKIMAFSQSQLQDIKSLNEDIETVMIVSTFYGDMSRLINDDALDNYAFSINLFVNNDHYVNSIHQSGKKVYSWTVNTEENIRSVARRDVDGIITDRPVFTREEAYLKNTSDMAEDLLDLLFDDD